MGVETQQETREFQTEVRQLLDLMIHSLYQDREIFLRELISNASDALEKLRFAALKDDGLYEGDADLKIRVEYNKSNRTITVLDNGTGMSRDDVVEYLGTIAQSGTKAFLSQLTGDQTKDSKIIGQFGVGFYSSFIVAKKVEVVTRKAGLPRTEGVRWVSEGTDNYTVETIDRPKHGTKIVLYLRDTADEFLDGLRLRQIIKKYSDHIAAPIVMARETQKDDGQNTGLVSAEETVNSATALWTRNKKDIKESEYDEFYKHVAHDFEAPLAHLHMRVEGKLEYRSLLFIPQHTPFDLWDRQQRHGLKLYVRRVFIMDDAEHLLPAYLRFVRGIVDSDDLPLNVSRETLQKNKVIDSIRAGITKKVLDLLVALADREPDKYATFWKLFGRVMKEGVVEEVERKDTLARLFRFASTDADTGDQTVSLVDYVGRMGDDQKAIYYVIADSFATAKNSPHLEKLRKDGVEVLLLSDPIDEWLTNHLGEFEGKPLRSAAKGEFEAEDNKTSSDTEAHAEQTRELLEKIKTALASKAKDVRTTERLTESAACLVADEQELGRNLERILQASGQEVTSSQPTLEINPAHPIVKKLADVEGEQFDDWAHILFDQALLSEGGSLDDPAAFVHRLNRLFVALGPQA